MDGIAGGYGEFGFRLTSEDNGFVLRDSIMIGGCGANITDNKSSYGGATIGNKLIFGGKYNCNDLIFRVYGFTGGNFGVFKTSNHSFFQSPFITDVFIGGGLEMQFAPDLAFVLEFGGNCRFLVGNEKKNFPGFSNSSPLLTIGYRTLI